MAAVVWLLAWLPPVLSGMSDLSPPGNLTLSRDHLKWLLTWQPGAGAPDGVTYHVSVHTDKGTSWVPVAGCQRVEQPLVCDLTGAVLDRRAVHFARVVAETEVCSSTAAVHPGFVPHRDTELDLPELTVRSCGRQLCVDLQPPADLQRGVYDSLDYKLRIQSGSADGAQFFRRISSLRGTALADLAPGRRYCVSVCIWDALESKESVYSPPVCAFTAGVHAPDLWLSAVSCVLLMSLVVTMVLLVYCGFFCPIRRPQPVVLTSVSHAPATAVLVPASASLTSLLSVGPTPPPAGGKRSARPSDDSDAESETEGSRGDCESLPFSWEEPLAQSSCWSDRAADLSADGATRGTEVDLLTLTFAAQEEDENERGLSGSEEPYNAPVQPARSLDSRQVAVETEEGEEEPSGYMERPGTGVLSSCL